MGLYVWGTGCGASELIEAGLEPERITAFVDSYPGGDIYLERPVVLPGDLPVAQVDLLIVTTRHTGEVAKTCERLGIPREKCLFLKNAHILMDQNAACARSETILGKELLKKLLSKQRIVSTPAQLADSRLSEYDLSNDYVRLATLELLCRQVEQLPGAAAELGVYKGYFARCINTLLPQKRLYLFDSFQGFAAEAGASASFQGAHEHTAVEAVLAIQPHPEWVIVKPGFFPASLEGLEAQFCLVSLDVDFENTTLEGLRYFWPRLVPGGFLMLHDWGNPKLPGVARALERYQEELGTILPAVPLPDISGSLVLCKGTDSPPSSAPPAETP